MAQVDPVSGVRIVGEQIAYADGSEAELIEIIEKAEDRSTGSDELAAHIHDWPTRYHLSRQRANLLRPLNLESGMRVLDVGAGTGVLSRAAGETGATVVGLEGSLERARVAAARCEGLDNVDIVCGRPSDLTEEDGFDIVLVVGVLEYAGAENADAFLADLRRLTRPGGSLVVAIENQFGLKYLLGYLEDHHAEPWIGIEGYPGPAGARTYSREHLSNLLDQWGFPLQRWLFPFPDYKLPSVVLAEAAYEVDDVETFVDQLVGHPVRDFSSPPMRLVDDRRAHREFLRAGLGRDVANSFLVVASEDAADPIRLVDDGVLAWHYGGERRRLWLRERRITTRNGERTVSSRRSGPVDERRELGWLNQEEPTERRFARGMNLEQLSLDACAHHDVDRLREILRRWSDHLAALESALDPELRDSHPFLDTDADRVLPPEYLDVELSNFVDTPDGLVYVDSEWRVPGGVDADLARARALWYFAERLVTSGAEHPWPAVATVRELAESLADLIGFGLSDDVVERLQMAEAELQRRVLGGETDAIVEHGRYVARRSRSDRDLQTSLPFTRLRREVARLDATRERLESQLESERSNVRRLEADLEELRQCARRLGDERDMWMRRWNALESRLPVRAYRALQRFLGRGPR